jgi:hypothetical protein
LNNLDLAGGASGSRGEFGGYGYNSIGDFLSLPSFIYAFDGLTVRSEIPGGQRIKACENNSPLPRDRVFFNYNHYHDAFLSDSNFRFFSGQIDSPLDNYAVGLEKTFCDGLFSLDLRVPFQGRVTYNFGNFFLKQQNNMGDVYLAAKVLLHDCEYSVLCGGMGMAFPTGSDIVGFVNMTTFEIDRQAFHLTPYLAYMVSVWERFYVTLWGQFDFDCSGNRYTTDYLFTQTGVVQESTAAYVSASMAWNLFENRCNWLQTLGGICEVHYSTTVGNEDAFYAPGLITDLAFGSFDVDGIVTRSAGNLSVVNMTAGINYELACGLNGRVAGVFPLSNGREARFPFEMVVQTEFRF